MTLNEAANYTKRGIAYFLIFLVLYIFAENLYKGFSIVYNKAFPEPPIPPSISFGKVTQPKITTLPIDLSTVEFRKELTMVGFPETPRVMYVYELEKPFISVAKEERFKNMALKLGFIQQAKKISDTRRLWENPVTDQSFTAEIFKQTYQLKTDYNFLENNYSNGNSPLNQKAVETAREFLQMMGDYSEEIKLAKYDTQGVTISEGILKQADTPYREMFKLVTVQPELIAYTTKETNEKGKIIDVETRMPIFFSNPSIPSINILAAPDNNQKINQAVEANYIYYRTADKKSYYPIITAEEAWEELLANRASIASVKKEGSDYFANSDVVQNIEKIDIREIVLGYYMPTDFVEHLQPIYVFKGRFHTTNRETGNIQFYLPALNRQTLITIQN